jgi:hypothetical protein
MRKYFCMLLSATILNCNNAWTDELSPEMTNDHPKKEKKCLFPKSKKHAPTWVCNAHIDGLTVAAVGSAAKSKAGLAFMEQMAVADARKRLAHDLHDSKQANTEENSTGSNKEDESVEHTKILKSTAGPHGSLYVLVGVDETHGE